VHHSVPQKLRGSYSALGVNLDSPENLRGVLGPRRLNKKLPNIHSQITQEWTEFLERVKKPTVEEVIRFRNYIDEKYKVF